jgi:protein-S-isoprenylcysteine O-methyltransferase Ste14
VNGTAPSRLPTLGPRGEGWVVGQLVLLGVCVIAGRPGLARIELDSPFAWTLFVAGLVLLAAGGWLFVAGLRDLGRSLTPLPLPRDTAALVETGIYRWLRHPIYAGLIVAAIGWAVLSASPWALGAALLLLAWLDAKARREEAWLLERYPGYAAYRARTKRILPGIY